MDMNWETALADLLSSLSGTQERMLDLLNRKRELIINRDHVALANLAAEEGALGIQLQACHDRRQHLLAMAAEAGMPADSISSIVADLPGDEAARLQAPVREAQQRAKLLRHQCLSQWVAMQKTMLHLSHLIEIIATRGQLKPTYGKGSAPANSGALMDQAV